LPLPPAALVDALDVDAAILHCFDAVGDLDQLLATASASVKGWRSTNFMLPFDIIY
jgi:hypothetical protein